MEILHTKEHERVDQLLRKAQETLVKMEKRYGKVDEKNKELETANLELAKKVIDKLNTPIKKETIILERKLETIHKEYTQILTSGENIICIEDLP